MTFLTDPSPFPPMTVYTLEVFDIFTAETVGFYPITVPDMEHLEGLAANLLVSMNYGRAGALDWRQIAEHPYTPPTARRLPKAATFGDKIGVQA